MTISSGLACQRSASGWQRRRSHAWHGGDAFAQVRECVDALAVSLQRGRTGDGHGFISQDVADIAARQAAGRTNRATSDEVADAGNECGDHDGNLREQGRTITVCADEIGRLVRASAETISDASGRLSSIVKTARNSAGGPATRRAMQRAARDREELEQGLATLEAIHEHVKEAETAGWQHAARR